jgi:hypothetical protein
MLVRDGLQSIQGMQDTGGMTGYLDDPVLSALKAQCVWCAVCLVCLVGLRCTVMHDHA